MRAVEAPAALPTSWMPMRTPAMWSSSGLRRLFHRVRFYFLLCTCLPARIRLCGRQGARNPLRGGEGGGLVQRRTWTKPENHSDVVTPAAPPALPQAAGWHFRFPVWVSMARNYSCSAHGVHTNRDGRVSLKDKLVISVKP